MNNEIEIDNLNDFIRNLNIKLKDQYSDNSKELEKRNQLLKQKLIENFDLYKSTKQIPYEMYQYIFDIIMDKKISFDLKNKLSECFDSNIKSYLLDLYIKNILPNREEVFISEDKSDSLHFLPKLNGCPLKYYFKKGKNIYSVKYDIPLSKLKMILLGNKLNDWSDYYSLRYLFQTDNFFKGNWVTNYIKELIQLVNNEEFTKSINDLIKNNDEILMENVTKFNPVKHKIHVNSELCDKILSNIPANFSLLEKTIYLYHLLCLIFTYDANYFFDDLDKIEKKSSHIKISNIPKYSKENNKIVCYEFAYIFSDLLRKLGVKNIIEQKSRFGKFRNYHTYIIYEVDGVIVQADSTARVHNWDIVYAKFSEKLNYIFCKQYNKLTRRIFKLAKNKVEEKIKNDFQLYELNFPNKKIIETLTINERLIIFNKYMLDNDLIGMDLCDYINELIILLNLDKIIKIDFFRKENFIYISLRLYDKYYTFINGDHIIDNFEILIDAEAKVIFDTNGILDYNKKK